MKFAIACFGVTLGGHALIVALTLFALDMQMVLRSSGSAMVIALIIIAVSIFQIVAFGVLANELNRRASWLIAALMILLTACFMFTSLSHVMVYEYRITSEDLVVILAVAAVSCGTLCWIKRQLVFS